MDDLIYLAANGDFVIYAIPNDIISSYPCTIIETGFPKYYDEPKLISLGSPISKKHCYNQDKYDHYSRSDWEEIRKYNDLLKCQVGELTYALNGPRSNWYEDVFEGIQPIHQDSFVRYRNSESERSMIILDISHMDPYLETGHCIMFYPNLEDLSIEEAINDGKLFLKKADISRIIYQRSRKQDDPKPEGGVSRQSLLKLVIGMAIGGYRFDPDAKRNDSLGAIEKRLQELDISLSADTIRNALREASALLPANPHKT